MSITPHTSELERPPEVELHGLEEPYRFQAREIIGEERYQLLKPSLIHLGGFATVYGAIDHAATDTSRVALKVYVEREELIRCMINRELNAHLDFNGTQGIVEATDMGIINEGPVPQRYLATRLAQGDFRNLKGNPGSSKKIQASIDMASQILPAMATLHGQGVVHRDIKPENILRYTQGDKTEWVIADFGLVGATPKRLNEIAAINPGSDWLVDGDPTLQKGSLIGSPGYIAPELIKDPDNVSPKADVFGIGVTLFNSSTGEFPFVSDSFYNYVRAVTKRAPVNIESVNRHIPTALGSLTMSCLDPNPENRPTSEELVREIASL